MYHHQESTQQFQEYTNDMGEQTDACYPCFICQCSTSVGETKFQISNDPNTLPSTSTSDVCNSERLQESNETFGRGTNDAALFPHLKTFYFLKEMISYPMNEIKELLRTATNPVDWLKFCSSCTGLIEKSMLMQRKVNNLLKQVESLNDQILAQIIKSRAPSAEMGFTKVKLNAHLKVRSYLASRHSVELENYFNTNSQLMDKAVPQVDWLWVSNENDEESQRELEEDFHVDPASDDNDPVNPPTSTELASCRRSKRNKTVSKYFQERDTLLSDEDDYQQNSKKSKKNDMVEYSGNAKIKRNPNTNTKQPKPDQEPPKKKIKRNKDIDWTPPVKVKIYKRKPRIRPRKTPKDSIRCVVCSTYVDDSTLHSHLATHLTDPSYIYPCPNEECKFTSISPYHLEKSHLHASGTNKCLQAAKLPLERGLRTCVTCSFSVYNNLAFQTHLQRHETGPKTIPCPISTCPLAFAVRQSVEFHLMDHISTKPKPVKNQICVLCKKSVLMSDMSSHLQLEHDITQPLQCQQCPRWFPSVEDLINHLRFHINKGTYCQTCGPEFGKFLRMKSLREHYFKQHNKGQKFDCPKCFKMYYKEDTFKIHKCIDQVSERVKRPRIFSCELCPHSCPSEDSLVAHKIDAHGADPFVCSHCPQKFSRRIKWQQHEATHGGVVVGSANKFKCDVCDKVFVKPGRLRRHKSIVHSEKNELEVVCDACGKVCRDRQALKVHVATAHDNVRYPCHLCGRQFTSKGSVDRHQLIHTGEKPFSCEVCGQVFRHLVSLKTHLKQHYKLGDKFKPHGPMKERAPFKIESDQTT